MPTNKERGCWIFLSHSSRDIEKVRFIRNEFEKYGHNPLAFHLLCLTTDTEEGRRELDGLIKREIDCREWFVFCESESASLSEYVRMEKEYILHRGKKKIWTLSMALSKEELAEKVAEICALVKVFVSYAGRDSETAKGLISELQRRNYDVWEDSLLAAGACWAEETEREIQKTAKSGFAVLVVTEAYLASEACRRERARLLEQGAQTVVVTVGNVGEENLRILMREITAQQKKHPTPLCNLPEAPRAEDMAAVADLVEAAQRVRIVGPIRMQADFFNRQKEIAERLNSQRRYHKLEAECVHAMGAVDDYCEVWQFPCCGRTVVVGDGPVSRFRSDGCCREEDNAKA